ncbi:MAG: hypothetical protein NT082_06615 [Chloroflexi bacterium]|nr:hypothetical protein [Chloroflexota bacterium]
MSKTDVDPEVKKAIDEIVEAEREDLYELFSKEKFDLTFDQREKLIDTKLKEKACKILEKHIEFDPDGVSKEPDETTVCHCGACAKLCRDNDGHIKIFSREIKTKQGIVEVEEHGYYCHCCRKVFFPSPQKAATFQRKLQP